jgi:hypothetical protein
VPKLVLSSQRCSLLLVLPFLSKLGLVEAQRLGNSVGQLTPPGRTRSYRFGALQQGSDPPPRVRILSTVTQTATKLPVSQYLCLHGGALSDLDWVA